MAQKRGFHSVLSVPFIYNLIQRIFRHKKTLKLWELLIGDFNEKVVLDVGCGTGEYSQFFKDSKKYIGIDLSDAYIKSAITNYGKNGVFLCMSLLNIEKLDLDKIDIVIMKGVIHHLEDNEVINFLKKIKSKLNTDAKLVTVDPVFVNRRFLSNYIVSLDRGMNIRNEKNMSKLVSREMKIKKKYVILQKFPPYQRILFELII